MLYLGLVVMTALSTRWHSTADLVTIALGARWHSTADLVTIALGDRWHSTADLVTIALGDRWHNMVDLRVVVTAHVFRTFLSTRINFYCTGGIHVLCPKTELNAEVGLQSLGQNISRPDQNFHVRTPFFKKTGPGDQNFQ